MKNCPTRNAIKAYLIKHPYAPVRRIQEDLGLSSPSHVKYHLDRLETPSTVRCPTCDGVGRLRKRGLP